MYGFWEEVGIPVVVIGGMLASIFAAIFLIVNFGSYRECSNFAQLAGAQTYFNWSTGCLVKNADQKWITLEAATRNNADITVRQK
jgi:hypothetical protein